MSKQKMMMARTLIDQKRYAAARKLLQTVDHPMAVKWLQQLDKIDPPPNTLQKPESITSQAEIEPKPVASVRQRRQPRQARTKNKPTRGATPIKGRPTWLIPLLTGISGLLVGVFLGMALSPSPETGILPLDLTRQAIIDANSTTDALVAEATARAEAGPSDLELTATAIFDLNATTIANINATSTAASQPTEPALEITQEPEDDFPFDFSDEEDEAEMPFDPSGSSPFGGTGSADDSSSGSPPFDTSGSPPGAEPTPTREGG